MSSSRDTTFQSLVTEAIVEEMHSDPSVILIGWQVSQYRPDIRDMFGNHRVIDTPISELGVLGVAAGAARRGKKPIIDLIGSSYFFLAFDQIIHHISLALSLLDGIVPMSLVLRGLHGIGEMPGGPVHSPIHHSVFMTVPGICIVYPSSPLDAKALMRASIRDPRPVIFLEHLRLYRMETESNVEASDIFFGRASIKREGKDVTVVAIGPMVSEAIAAARELEKAGINTEVIDPRTLAPLDYETISMSVSKTGRLLIADEAYGTCSAASQIAAVIAERAFFALKAPIRRLTVPEIPILFNPAKEWFTLSPTARRIQEAAEQLVSCP